MEILTLSTSLNQVDIHNLASPKSFAWPASLPPSITNLALAEALCKQFLPISQLASVIACNHQGWSAQDCIKVESAGQRFMVKIPRMHTAESVTTCRAEATRAKWAGEAGIGPEVLVIDEDTGGYVMAFVDGEALTPKRAADSTGRIVELLKRLHGQQGADAWMMRYDPILVVRRMLQLAKLQGTMRADDVKLIEQVLVDASKAAEYMSVDLKPSHNDLHSLNMIMDEDSKLFCIDFEDMNLTDPMWDLAYFTANIELPPLELADVYGCSKAERRRLEVFYFLAISHFAT